MILSPFGRPSILQNALKKRMKLQATELIAGEVWKDRASVGGAASVTIVTTSSDG